MRLRLTLLFLLTLAVAPVATQSFPIPIHGSSQKSFYTSPADFPLDYPESQCHWDDVGVNPLGDLAHTHLKVWWPPYVEWATGPLTVKWTAMLYHTDGYVDDPGLYGWAFQSPYVTKYTLDAPWSWPVKGDPTGLIMFSGTVTIDPGHALAIPVEWNPADRPVPHGWYNFHLVLRANYPKSNSGQGGHVDTYEYIPIYSTIDRSKPEQSGEGVVSVGHPRYSTYCWAWGDWNAIVTETFDILPILAPVAANSPASFTVFGENYGTNESVLFPAIFEERFDPDLHHGIPGALITGQTAPANRNPNIGMTIKAILPGTLPTGPHKFLFRYNRPATDGVRELDSLLLVPVTISSSTPPPPPPPPTGCTPGNATTPATVTALDGSVKHYLVTVDAACNPLTVVGPF